MKGSMENLAAGEKQRGDIGNYSLEIIGNGGLGTRSCEGDRGGGAKNEQRSVDGSEKYDNSKEKDRKSTRLNSSHQHRSRMPSSA